jgi:hypothetical protein
LTVVRDFNIVVVDSCPYDNNREWCPRNVGDVNNFGFEYHFDLVKIFQNFFFTSSPTMRQIKLEGLSWGIPTEGKAQCN